MRKLLTSAALLVLAFTGTSHAMEAQDFSDRTEWTCNKEAIEEYLAPLIEDAGAPYGLKLVYVKSDMTEISRSEDELRCRISYVTNQHTRGKSQKATFYFMNEDGNALVGFEDK